MFLRVFFGILFWIKLLILHVVTYLRKGRKKKRFDLYDVHLKKDPYKISMLSPLEEWKLELPRSSNFLEADEVCFSGINSLGSHLLVHVTKSSSGRAEAWLHLKLQNGKMYTQSLSGIYIEHQNCFRVGCLLIECLAPMRRWRIVYNGLLNSADDGDEIHAKLNFLWFPLSLPYDFLSDIPPKLIASNSGIHSLFRSTLWPSCDRYEQGGQLKGTINIEGEDEEIEEYLWGVRSRSLVSCASKQEIRLLRFFGYAEDGIIYSILVDFSNPSQPQLSAGYLVPFSWITAPIQTGSVDVALDGSVPLRVIKVAFTADKHYTMQIELKQNNGSFLRDVGHEGRTVLWSASFTVNDMNGKGFLVIENMQTSSNVYDEVLEMSAKSQEQFDISCPLVVGLTEHACKLKRIAGGKGSSLAKLEEISQMNSEFSVANGIVVSCHAYREFVKDEKLQSAISLLQDIAWGKTTGNLKQACEMVTEKITNHPLPNSILNAISKKLQSVFQDALEDTKFAVRSSALGEDAENTSAAGQMETFLGIKGLQEILQAVKKCWASQFRLTAVTYKRSNGQLINSDMAVVIQEMVPAETAGVMFTCDPVTSNVKYITITANYGLGETVVSAVSEPDTIKLKHINSKELAIESVQVGSKKVAMFLKDNDSGTESKIDDERQKSCCLTEEQILQLGLVGTLIYRWYEFPQDIEWAYVGDKVYILQSRPVTSIFTETKFELSHEMDVAQFTDSEYVSNANVGEVLPGAVTPLTITFVLPIFYSGIGGWLQKMDGPFAIPFFPYARKGGTMAFNQAFNSITDNMLMNTTKDGKDSIMSKAVIIGTFGHLLDDPDLRKACANRQRPETALHSLYKNMNMLKIMFSCKKRIERRRKEWWNCKYSTETLKTAAETYSEILSRSSDIFNSLECLYYGSFSSLICNMMVLIFLANGKDLDCLIFSTFAELLKSNDEDIESADVPKALKKLAQKISCCMDPNKFKSMTQEDALKWLEETTTEAKDAFKKYMDQHGHRSYKEYDLRTVPWKDDPLKLIKVLQRMVEVAPAESQMGEVKSRKNGLENINIPLGFLNKLFLRLLLPFSRRSVAYREQGKSIFVKHLGAFRALFHHLAALMVSEGYLPEKDLLFFLTLEEIGQLLESRTPQLVHKAKQRQKLHPELDNMKFPEIIKGIIRPVCQRSMVYQNGTTSVQLKGTPVCQGSVQGKARVAVTLEDADELKAGEILITYCTDIAWSPYFPLLSGIVTEIGGLCSHGAVIARECNLPCLVGVTGVTAAFTTGDEVFLDAKNGTITRIDKVSDDVANHH